MERSIAGKVQLTTKNASRKYDEEMPGTEEISSTAQHIVPEAI
jgi:hypothetical protein